MAYMQCLVTFLNADDLDEDDIPLGRDGMIQDAKNY